MKRVIRAARTHYFGDEASAKYGDLISEKLSGKTVSKRRDTAEEPGGLIYEANKLGIDMWDLLEALEGMCYEGRAHEIDDSTYRINPSEPESINSSIVYNVDDYSPNAMIAEINAKVKDPNVSFIKLQYTSRYGAGCTCFKRDENSWLWVNDKGLVMNRGTINEKNSLNLSDSYVARQLIYSLRNNSCTKLVVE